MDYFDSEERANPLLSCAVISGLAAASWAAVIGFAYLVIRLVRGG